MKYVTCRWINVGEEDTMTELPLTEKVPGKLTLIYSIIYIYLIN